MSAKQEATILDAVASSTLPKRQALRDLGVPKSTYYRWLNRHRLDDRPGGGPTPWNRLSPEEEQAVLTAARAVSRAELSPAGCMAHRQQGLLRLRVHRLSHPS